MSSHIYGVKYLFTYYLLNNLHLSTELFFSLSNMIYCVIWLNYMMSLHQFQLWGVNWNCDSQSNLWWKRKIWWRDLDKYIFFWYHNTIRMYIFLCPFTYEVNIETNLMVVHWLIHTNLFPIIELYVICNIIRVVVMVIW